MSKSSDLLGPRASRPPSFVATRFEMSGSSVTRVNALLDAGGTPAVPVKS